MELNYGDTPVNPHLASPLRTLDAALGGVFNRLRDMPVNPNLSRNGGKCRYVKYGRVTVICNFKK
jgi:hypothetical protein